MDIKSCGVCSKPLTEQAHDVLGYVKIASQGEHKEDHFVHQGCWEQVVMEAAKVDKSVQCPACKVKIAQGKTPAELNKALKNRVQKYNLSSLEAKKVVKWVTGLSVAAAVMVLASTLFPHMMGLIGGALLAVGVGIFSARYIGSFLQPPKEILKK